MATITSRSTFKDYCLKRLGFPVIDINVDDDQIEDRIDDAIQYWQDYHFDGLQKVYYIKAITGSALVATANVTPFINNARTLVGVTSGASASINSVNSDHVTISVNCGQIPFVVGEAINYIDANNVTHSAGVGVSQFAFGDVDKRYLDRSEEHTSELQSH